MVALPPAPAAKSPAPLPTPPVSGNDARSRPTNETSRAPARAPTPPRPIAEVQNKPAVALELRGRVQLTAGHGQQLHPGEAVDTVVWFVPAAGMPAPRPRHADIVTAHRDFRPSAIAVPLGSTVSFVNQDTVRHNVFSVTSGAAFNLGYQGAGKRADHVFARPGLVLISCNVHHSMEMDVFVVRSPYAGRAAADGSFVLRGLPAGPGELFAWNPRARLARRAVAMPSTKVVSLPLLAERPRVVTEINMGGRP